MQYEEIKTLCNQLQVDFNQFFILKSINDFAEDDYLNIKELTKRDDIHKHNIEVLCSKKYIALVFENNQLSLIDVIKEQIPVGFENLMLLDNAKTFFTPVEKTETFCERMYSKFPKIKIPTSGSNLQSGEMDFVKKLIKFIKEHKFNNDTIEKAIDLYIYRGHQNNWQYFQTAGYFVNKLGSSSKLEEYCEEVKDFKKEDMNNIISGQINLFSNDI